MPELSRFFGIVAKMYLLGSEHNPPHVHFIHDDKMAAIDVNTATLIEGDLPPKELALVIKWTKEHKDELIEIWESQVFKKISPLE